HLPVGLLRVLPSVPVSLGEGPVAGRKGCRRYRGRHGCREEERSHGINCWSPPGAQHPCPRARRRAVWRPHTVATTFSSMAIGVGRQLISSVVRQGGSCSKYSFHSRLYTGKSSFMLVRKTVTSTIFSQL